MPPSAPWTGLFVFTIERGRDERELEVDRKQTIAVREFKQRARTEFQRVFGAPKLTARAGICVHTSCIFAARAFHPPGPFVIGCPCTCECTNHIHMNTWLWSLNTRGTFNTDRHLNLHLQLGILELPINLQSNQQSQWVQLSRKTMVLQQTIGYNYWWSSLASRRIPTARYF